RIVPCACTRLTKRKVGHGDSKKRGGRLVGLRPDWVPAGFGASPRSLPGLSALGGPARARSCTASQRGRLGLGSGNLPGSPARLRALRRKHGSPAARLVTPIAA